MSRAAGRHHLRERAAAAAAFALWGSGCAKPSLALEIPVRALVGGAPFSCTSPMTLGSGEALAATNLLFFVHDLRLVDDKGAEVPVALTADGRWQVENTALLDFEDGQGLCRNGSAETHTRLVGAIPAGTYRGLKVRLGVPFALNHIDPTHAPPPLTGTEMSWGWQAGYKFLRLEGKLSGKPMRVHLGSTGCEGTIGDISACSHPNRAELSVATFEPGQAVAFDLDRLLEGLSAATATLPGAACMGGADEPGCAPVYTALGIDLKTGAANIAGAVLRAP